MILGKAKISPMFHCYSIAAVEVICSRMIQQQFANLGIPSVITKFRVDFVLIIFFF